MSYSEWFENTFNTDESKVQDREWTECDRVPEVDPERAVKYLSRCFTGASALLDVPEGRVAGGLFRLANSCEGDHIRALNNDKVPFERRFECWRSMATLFEDFFAVACRTYIGHDDTGWKPRGPLDIPCYMWWDVIPLWPKLHVDDEVAMLPAVLEVMERSLATDSISCQESALHGFYCYGEFFRERAIEIISSYFAVVPSEHPLRKYAEDAREWMED